MNNHCLNDVWKELNWIEITHSIMHYLFAIDTLHKKNWYSRWVDIAQELWVTAWSCSISIKNLIKKWLIQEDDNKFLKLSNNWKEIVEKWLYKRNILIDFFENKLNLDYQISQSNACKIEHLLSDEVIDAIKKIK